MKAEIEHIPSENYGIEVTSETEVERQHLESLWNRHAAVLVLTRNRLDGSVTLTIGPVATTEHEGLGIKGIRDPQAPCNRFDPRAQKLHDIADCQADGHYLCGECCYRS